MFKKIIIFFLLCLALYSFFWYRLNSPADKNGQEKIFTVNLGETANQVAQNLKKNNLIKSVFYFNYLAKHEDSSIKAGTYSINPASSTKEIFKILSQGNNVNEDKAITIIEGWDIRDINYYLKANNLLPENSFLDLASQSIKDLKNKIALDQTVLNDLPAAATLEGFLFPDTYRIKSAATAVEIINIMLKNFDKKISPEMRQEIERQRKTLFEIITMASIVEREVRTEADMKLVAGIFWNRLEYGLPLQADATLSYILDDKVSAHTLDDLKIDSPYNTYKYRGLPPGPIANPGEKAILAAIYPAETEYLYFLSDPATGRTIYSRTLEEHNRSKAKYLP